MFKFESDHRIVFQRYIPQIVCPRGDVDKDECTTGEEWLMYDEKYNDYVVVDYCHECQTLAE